MSTCILQPNYSQHDVSTMIQLHSVPCKIILYNSSSKSLHGDQGGILLFFVILHSSQQFFSYVVMDPLHNEYLAQRHNLAMDLNQDLWPQHPIKVYYYTIIPLPHGIK